MPLAMVPEQGLVDDKSLCASNSDSTKGCKLADYNREIRIEVMLCAEMQSSCVTSTHTD